MSAEAAADCHDYGLGTMTYRKILVPFAGTDDVAALDAALTLGRKFKAQVQALSTVHATAGRTRPGDSSSAEQATEGSVAVSSVGSLFRQRCNAFDEAHSRFSPSSGFSARDIEESGSEAELIAGHGRLADLIVLAHPQAPQPPWPNLSLETALRETGRPVLVIAVPVGEFGNRVVIGWNGSAEATRAIAYSLPILHLALQVAVVTAGERIAHPPGPALVEYLGCHGIQAKSIAASEQGQSETTIFAAACLDHHADLIVMGAFTRQTTGTRVFGSMTAEMIRQTRWSVFMAH